MDTRHQLAHFRAGRGGVGGSGATEVDTRFDLVNVHGELKNNLNYN